MSVWAPYLASKATAQFMTFIAFCWLSPCILPLPGASRPFRGSSAPSSKPGIPRTRWRPLLAALYGLPPGLSARRAPCQGTLSSQSTFQLGPGLKSIQELLGWWSDSCIPAPPRGRAPGNPPSPAPLDPGLNGFCKDLSPCHGSWIFPPSLPSTES